MAEAYQNTLSGGHYLLTEESFNSSLAHVLEGSLTRYNA